MVVFTSCLVILMVNVSGAWLTKYDTNAYGGWTPNRRSSHCIRTGGECLHTDQCCNYNDVCLVNQKKYIQTGKMTGLCKEKKNRVSNYFYKQEGEKCSDSLECVDMCCRAIFRHRYGMTRVCGRSNGPFMCITRKSKQINNGISNDVTK